MHALMPGDINPNPKSNIMAQSDWLVTLKLKKLPDLQSSVRFLELNGSQRNTKHSTR